MSQTRRGTVYWRRWVLAVATLALGGYALARRGELEQFGAAVSNVNWHWLPLAIVSEAFFQCNEASIYWIMYRVIGHRPRLSGVIALTLAASFVNRVVPTAGVSGTAFFSERMARRGVPVAATITVNVARYVLDYGAFLVVLGVGLLYLSAHRELTALEMHMAGTLGALALATAFLGLFLLTRRNTFRRLVAGGIRIGNRIGSRLSGRTLFAEQRVVRATEEVASALAVLARSRSATAVLVVMGFFIHLFDLAGLLVIFLATGYPVHLGVLSAGYGLAYLAGFVSLVPSGLGVFEASMTAVYASLGVPLETALLVTICYRLFSLWLPLLVGYVMLHISFGREDKHEAPI